MCRHLSVPFSARQASGHRATPLHKAHKGGKERKKAQRSSASVKPLGKISASPSMETLGVICCGMSYTIRDRADSGAAQEAKHGARFLAI